MFPLTVSLAYCFYNGA